MYLIGDIGNTETKIFLFNEKLKLKKKWTISSISLTNTYLDSKIKLTLIEISKIKKILFSSVVPNTFQLIKKFLIKKNKKLKIYEKKQIDFKKLIKLKVNRKQVGSDRIANAIGVTNNNKNYIVIDFGTATTFDIVGKNGSYDGGIIAPGINLSLEALYSATSRLPKIAIRQLNDEKNTLIGRNTIAAIESGVYWGYVCMIEGLIFKLKKIYKNSKILVTGGLSSIFIKNISTIDLVEKDLTILGLAHMYISHFKINR